jgi:hypothetical protein
LNGVVRFQVAPQRAAGGALDEEDSGVKVDVRNDDDNDWIEEELDKEKEETDVNGQDFQLFLGLVWTFLLKRGFSQILVMSHVVAFLSIATAFRAILRLPVLVPQATFLTKKPSADALKLN